MFSHECLDVYRVALEFDRELVKLVPRRGFATLRDQLDRASAGIIANIAEGAGRRTSGDKVHFYTIARGSATECASLIDMMRNRNIVAEHDYTRCRELLLRIVQMLCRLCERE